MSDLDFSHRVGEVPAGAALPQEYARQTHAEVTPTPDIQGAVNQFAANSNWMSQVGSTIAVKSSNAIAAKIGSQMGKDPHGDLMPSFTDFDKNLAASYDAQAQSTLGLQAQKLITQSNLELAAAPRLNGGMIASAQKHVYQGLQKIYSLAPQSIRPQMEQSYGSMMLNQSEHLTNRMLTEQREDRRNLTALASQKNAENASSLAMAGNYKAAEQLIETTKAANDADIRAGLISPVDAKTKVDTVRLSAKSGKSIHEYEIARTQGKGEEYLKSVAEKSDKGDPDYITVTNNLMAYVNHQEAMRSEDQQLRVSKFNTSVAMNPVAPDMAMQLQDLKNNVSPIAYEKAQLSYIQARKAYEQNAAEQQDLVHNWGDSAAQARSSEKLQNKTFDALVNNVMQKQGVPRDQAENQVAMSAGAPIPVFTKTITDKLTSGNPASIVGAALQMQNINDAEGGHALIGVSTQAKTIGIQFLHQRGSMPDADLARKITDNFSKIDDTLQKTLDNSWNLKLSVGGAAGLGATKSLANFALTNVGIDKKDFGGKYFETIYGNDIYDEFKSNFDASRGDFEAAKQITKDSVNQRYGETRVNGGVQFTDSPIEKALGYKDPGVVPFIQDDLLRQLNTSFEKNKNDNDYWEVKPRDTGKSISSSSISSAKKSLLGPILSSLHGSQTYQAPEIIRHVKTDKGMQTYRYPVNLVGRPGGKWDVVVQTPSGPRNLFLGRATSWRYNFFAK